MENTRGESTSAPRTIKPRLVVHIGAGKTGSSSIQKTLEQNASDLQRQGFKYLGLMLEGVGQKSQYEWHFKSGSPRFFAQDAEKSSDEIYGVLREELDALERSGIRSAIWSNEWMFTRESHIIPALECIASDGNDVTIICYIRRHDEWAKSAYAQWGVKHKSYPGPLRPFAQWKQGRSFAFFPAVEPWLESFQGSVSLFNYDAAGDVVAHFCAAIGYSPATISRDNTTPAREVIAA